MSDKLKNTLTNLLGLKLTIAASYFYFTDGIKLSEYCVILGVGLALFLFKADQTKNFIMKFLHKKAGISEKK